VRDPKGGEKLACVAVPKRLEEGERETEENSTAVRHERARKALERAFAKLPMNQQPALIFLIDADLPRTATRKVQRNKVKEIAERLAEAQRAAKQSALRNGKEAGHTSSVVRAAIASIARKDPASITASTRLRDELGFDSLMAMELATTLESVLGTHRIAEELLKIDTVGALEEALGVQVERVSNANANAKSKIRGSTKDDSGEEKTELPLALKALGRAAAAVAQREFYERVLKVTVTGRAFIPHNRNTLVVANHASHLDMGLVKYALGTYGRDLVALAAKDYFFEGNRVRTMFVENFTNLVPLDRNAGLRQTLRAVGSLIEEGKTVLIFPEGTRSTDGTIRPFKGAVGYLALQHRIDILPVYVGGTFEALPKGAKWLRRRDVSAKIGLPLEIQELERLCAGLGPVDRARRVAQIAQKAVEELKAGRVLDLRKIERWSDEEGERVHPLVRLFHELGRKFKPGVVRDPVSFYFTLGNEPEAKWTVKVSANECSLQQGKPDGGNADCVLKTTPDMFTKIVREHYTPSASEFMAGLIKSNDVALLETFQKAFGLG
jgi:long-chain acyl-CoA synthetase